MAHRVHYYRDMTDSLTILNAIVAFLVGALPQGFEVTLDGYSVLITGDDRRRVNEAKRIAARFAKISTGRKFRHATHGGAKSWRDMEDGTTTAGISLPPTDDCKCDRCGGAGSIKAFSYYASGTCFECDGSGWNERL